MNKAQQRVAIAKDALAWVQAGALIPTKGVYVLPEHRPTDKEGNKQLRDVVLGKCMVCAKGALFLAKAVRFDNVIAKEYWAACKDDDGAALREHFERDQLELIEYVFEGWDYMATNLTPLQKTIQRFKEKYPGLKARMIAVLQNIIDHDGTFVPDEV